MIEKKIGDDEKCNDCKECAKDKSLKLVGPVSFFHVGSNFGKDEYMIVFVGKNTWYGKEDFEKEKKIGNVADVRESGKDSIMGKKIQTHIILNILEL